ncbi:MAG: pseudouridine synthase [Pedobacter sp.]|nr:MAG: pseudouridine synthase [Pedobacter sp.]
MTKDNNRNSRDDKSKPGNRSTTGRRPSGTDSSYKGKSKFDDKEGKDNKFGGSRDFKPRDGEKKDFRPRTPRDGESRDFKPRSSEGRESKPREGDRKDFKPRGARDDSKSFRPRSDKDNKDFKPRGARGAEGDFKPRAPRSADGDYKPRSTGDRDFKPRTSRDGDSKDYKPRAPRAYKEGSSRETPPGEKTRSYIKKDNFGAKGDQPFRKFDDKTSQSSRSTDSRPFRKRDESGKPSFQDRGERVENAPTMRNRKNAPVKDDGLIRLNRYIANSGICSRRKADELIAAGVVSVNGEVVSELGHKVDPFKDEIRYNGELLKREKRVYVLLNKPKDYITTTDDPQERRTVMQLVEKASRERIYPVGRLDRNTTGLLLMTNDGDLADKLSHPKNGITKIYHVELSRSLSQGDLNKIQFGLELEDGIIKPDSVSYVTGGSKREVGIQIHSGKNRIVRRIFEHLGYDVVKLDRVVYGNLTKKDLPRGRWRFLEEHELIQIKHLIK